MTADQMLWHCNQVLKTALGDIGVKPNLPPFPVPMLKFHALHPTVARTALRPRLSIGPPGTRSLKTNVSAASS